MRTCIKDKPRRFIEALNFSPSGFRGVGLRDGPRRGAEMFAGLKAQVQFAQMAWMQAGHVSIFRALGV